VSNDVTIYEVARAAGVSISTVSNALNRPKRVGELTRERVLAVADRLGFVPKAEAVSKARKAMRRVAVLAPFCAYKSYLERLAGALAEASRAGIEVSAFDHESLATASSPVLAGMPIRGQLDGIIVMGMNIEEVVERRLLQREVPTVVVDADSDRFPVVTCDDVAGGAMAGEHLYRLGHRHFGYIVEGQLSSYESQALRRLSGFRQSIETHRGTTVTVVESDSSIESARSAARALLRDGRTPPTAIMAHFDELALGALRGAKDLGLAVPETLSIMGYDDGPLAIAADLTTIRQPFRESGSFAMRALLDMIESRSISRQVTYLPIELVERSTTARRSSWRAGNAKKPCKVLF